MRILLGLVGLVVTCFVLGVVGIFLLGMIPTYNYGVAFVDSPALANGWAEGPVEGPVEGYEFRTTLYEREVVVAESVKRADVEIWHMTDYMNRYESAPEGVWRQGYMNFALAEGSGVALVPDSVVVEYRDEAGNLYEPAAVDSTSSCTEAGFCSTSFFFSFTEALPETLRERVVFTLEIDGEEEVFEYEMVIEYVLAYRLWDLWMGV
ncbi:MAG TPA: hypothetical protein VLL52_25540 [Anaerolineae bacterium]|nr:hypothetical protein [Anaerolineae bacterium]